MSTPQGSLQYLLRNNQYIVSYIEDAELNRIMNNIGAQKKTNIVNNQSKKYWFVPSADFESIRSILHEFGYTEYNADPPKPASADYQVSSSPAKAPQPDPRHNPFKYFEVNVQDPQARDKYVQNHTYSVSELNRSLSDGIRNFFPSFWLIGEITGFNPKKGHIYFQLVENVQNAQKNQNYNIDVVIWQSNIQRLIDKLHAAGQREFQNGDKIRVFGKLNFYDVGGKLTFIIQDIDTYYAEGEFYKQKLQIENELTRQGIHDSNKRLPFPILPLRLAIFSARGAAGMGDFEKTLSESGYPFKITLFTIALQGKNVEQDFMNSYQMLEQIGFEQFDLGLVMRGGGSIVDLSAFNSLNISRTIALSPLKFLIGIGHDRDRCVLDEIATRALTPTDAGKILVNACESLSRDLEEQRLWIESYALHLLESYQNALKSTTERFTHAASLRCKSAADSLEKQKLQLTHNAHESLNRTQYSLTHLGQNLKNSALQLNHRASLELHSLENQVRNQSNALIQNKHENLKLLATRVTDISSQNLKQYKKETDNLKQMISAYNPNQWFKRGFVLLSDKSGNAITSIQAISPKDIVNIRLKDGKATASIKTVTPETTTQEK